MRDFLSASNNADLIECTNFWAQTTVDTKDFAVNDSTEDKEIKDLAAGFPDGGIAVFLLTLFVEPVDLSDLAGFVVAANQGDAVGIAVELVSRRQAEAWRETYRALRQRSRVKVSRL